jgi:hypothetical protein
MRVQTLVPAGHIECVWHLVIGDKVAGWRTRSECTACVAAGLGADAVDLATLRGGKVAARSSRGYRLARKEARANADALQVEEPGFRLPSQCLVALDLALDGLDQARCWPPARIAFTDLAKSLLRPLVGEREACRLGRCCLKRSSVDPDRNGAAAGGETRTTALLSAPSVHCPPPGCPAGIRSWAGLKLALRSKSSSRIAASSNEWQTSSARRPARCRK